VAATQQEIYAGLDSDLSWSEQQLPERERTKHVHRLHPYLGKYIPQLVEELFRRHVPARGRVLDPFAGSGTTLVQALESGLHSVGVDIAAFNCLLMHVKTNEHKPFVLEHELRDALARFERGEGKASDRSAYVRAWFAPQAREDLLRFRSLIGEYEHADVLRIVLARAARSARLTTHFDLDFPRAPVTEPYYCLKHKRECRPVGEAWKFLGRYTIDTVRRIRTFAPIRGGREAVVLHGDARTVRLPVQPSGVITSPPYPGLIDYHEQHRYAYELLGLSDRRTEEIGPAAAGTSRPAFAAYVESMIRVFENTAAHLPHGARVLVVVNDSRNLYPEILANAGLYLEGRITRHVNRRTGRRAGEFFEDVLLCRAA
jgi:hypothetical protein